MEVMGMAKGMTWAPLHATLHLQNGLLPLTLNMVPLHPLHYPLRLPRGGGTTTKPPIVATIPTTSSGSSSSGSDRSGSSGGSSGSGSSNSSREEFPSLQAPPQQEHPTELQLSFGLEPLASALLEFPKSVWRQIAIPLSNFGFGKRSVGEGGIGLFILSGAFLFAFSLSWLKGYRARASVRKYHAVVELSDACGVAIGTPVRIRGVDAGNVVSIRPNLESIDVEIQVLDTKVVIPRNSLVEVNQSGLLMETQIDISPRSPLPQPSVDPLNPRCSEEGAIVCNMQRIKGEQGVNLDKLVSIFTKLAREVDAISITQIYSLAERVSTAVEDAKPLLEKMESLAGDVEPLLKEVRDGGIMKELEKLVSVLSEACIDMRKINKSVLTPENLELLRQSVSTLTKTLKNVERISGDVSSITGDQKTLHNMKQLIDSLSRLMAD